MTSSQFDSKRTFKLVVVGDIHVGKTSLVSRYVHGQYTSSYASTSGGDIQTKEVAVNGCLVEVNIVDTMGQPDVKSLIKSLYRNAHGIMVVYDVTQQTSFCSVNEWMEHIRRHIHEEPIFLIVGNKRDLEHCRMVATKEAEHKAATLEVPHFEVSAKTNENVETAFNTLIREVWLKRKFRFSPSMYGTVGLRERAKITVSSPRYDGNCCS